MARRPVALLALLTLLTLVVVGGTEASARPATEARGWALGGRPCTLVPVAAPLAAGTGCPGVRPGAAVRTPVGQCTLNFLWRGSDDLSYMGTAGHCLLEGSGVAEASFPPGSGPAARDSGGRRIGRFAYAVLDEGRDFALVRLDPGVAASPEVCELGGPTGTDAAPLRPLTPLRSVGRGTLTGDLLPARPQLVVDGADPRLVVALGVASAGESGSPLVSLDGRAVGVVVAISPVLPLLAAGVLVHSTRLAPQIARASQVTGIGFALQTAPTR